RLTEALAAHREALRLRPDDPWVYNQIGNDLRGLGQAESAVEHYQRALQVDPKFAEAQQNLGNALVSLGELEQAVAVFSQALRLRPGMVEARRSLVSTLQMLRPSAYRPDLEETIKPCFHSSEVTHQPLARITASQLRYKHRLSGDSTLSGHGSHSLLRTLAADELFTSLLSQTFNVDPELERVLITLRRNLFFEHVGGSEISDEYKGLISALGLQCFSNEYVFHESKEENEAVQRLKKQREHAYDRTPKAVEELENTLLLLSMYLALATLSCARALDAVPLGDWRASIRPVIERTLKEPLAEQRIEQDIESLGPIGDATSRAVRAQYEENPYPRWLDLPRYVKMNLADSLRRTFPHFTPPDSLRGPLRVLVAGCGTGQEPIAIAMARANAQVLAMDLSRRSLAYGVRMARKLRVYNVRFLQGDILEIPRLKQQFHVIECAGVLHHMDDPMAGWRVLVDHLVTEGVMKIGLYSEAARQAIVAARTLIRDEGLAPVPDDIKALRARILRGETDSVLAELVESEELYTLSSCRDLLFHAREHRFTLSQIRAALEQLGLALIGFELPTLQMKQRYRELFPGDVEMTDLSAWRQFEERYPAAFSGLYVFWCQKK
ncbi:MAG: tetratricopeptide repeat protein, partial [Acidiferrobacterales bacterium]